MKISLAILTLNEIEGTRALFGKIPWGAVDEAVVVDGNSIDGTSNFFTENGVRVVYQTAPGLGEAMFTARRAVTGDAIIFFHPDGNEDPADIPRFRAYLERGCDLVVASRMLPGGFNEEDEKLVRKRKWANLGFALVANLLWRREGAYVTDMMNGFRAVTRDAFDRMCLDARGCTIDYQMIIRAFKARMRIAEFPTREGRRVSGETKFKSVPTGLRMIGLLRDELLRGRRVFAPAAPEALPARGEVKLEQTPADAGAAD
jgi:glycosyltransferase involved in cell wall biosynthesis